MNPSNPVNVALLAALRAASKASVETGASACLIESWKALPSGSNDTKSTGLHFGQKAELTPKLFRAAQYRSEVLIYGPEFVHFSVSSDLWNHYCETSES